MSKFTRGKWTESDGVITASDEKGVWIRNVADILCCEDEDEEKANARLIAAAPELYEMLKELALLNPCVAGCAVLYARELLARIDGGEASDE